MAGITSKVYKIIKAYVKHNSYRRLTPRSWQSRSIKLSRRSWRVKISQPTIKLQSKVKSEATLSARIRRSYMSDVLVFLLGGEAGLMSGRRASKKCVDSEVCDRQSPISRQVSLNDCELKRKLMLNMHIPELLPMRRNYGEGQGFADLRPVNSVRISVAF